ncbi:MAG TPA: M56 family metallopeptidase [Bryobacteraceae bacterium]|nr:M56 family metallopeptidase [Bryobacteraceae bacterium]
MTTLQFLAEWALRSSILILSGTLLLWALRVKDPSIRLAAWTVMLAGSLAIPALSLTLPKVPLVVMRTTARPVELLPVSNEAALPRTLATRGHDRTTPFDWALVALMMYVLVTLALLLRLCIGLAMGLRLLRSSRAAGQKTEGIDIRESDRVASPVALGIARPAIVLPSDWRQWGSAKLDAVLAHERSHIRRHDPEVQLLSAIHRALLWYSPLSWFLHQRIVRAAEEASDDAAVAVTRDRALYAEVLLDFMQRGVRNANWLGLPMARYGRPDDRIHRILDGTVLSRGVTRWSVAAILALGSPLAFVVAMGQPQSAAQAQAAPGAQAPVQATMQKTHAAQVTASREPAYLYGLGSVTAYSVTVKPRIDGQLMSVSFKEGEMVHEGQVLAFIDPRPYQIQLAQAEGQLAQDQGFPAVNLEEGKIKSDRAAVDNAKLQLSYAEIRAPITGTAGLRLVDPGNVVHAGEPSGIVIITQLQPIWVLFDVPEDAVPRVRARLRQGANGANLPVEAWNRDNTVKVATGQLIAVDNQIDSKTGTVKLKALFGNKDGALFPNQFVNVRLLLKTP